MNKNQKKICSRIFTNKEITIQKLSEEIGISTTSIENHIKKLKQNSILERVGGRKEGHWELNLEEKER